MPSAPTDRPTSPDRPRWGRGRLVYWSLAALVLVAAAVGTRVTDEVTWTLFDFAVAAGLLAAVGLAFEAVARRTASTPYRWGAALALGTAFILVWALGAVGVIGSEDEPVNLLYFGVLAVGAIGAALARLRPRGMARALAATAAAQAAVAVGALVGGWGTPLHGALEVVVINAGFVALWAAAAACFLRAARETPAGPTPSERSAAGSAAALIVFALFAGPPAGAQNTQGAPPDVDGVFAWASPDAPGCVAAVDHRGERVVQRAAGAANLETGAPLTLDTRFDVGSVVKQVVAATVVLLAEDGRLSLADDVRRYIPELPDPGHAVTLDHLLTHTGGVRDWTALQRLAPEPEEALALVLRQRGLDFPPGTAWAYSNSGYVLLKEVVTRVAGAPFGEIARARLFEPLGMARTVYAEDAAAVPGLAHAYAPEGDGWRPDVLTGPTRGGGGALYSTAGDLLRWNRALSEDHLGPAVTAALHEPARLANGRVLPYGRGLFLDDDRAGPVVWHGGSAAGYKSTLVRSPREHVSIAVLCNAGDAVRPTDLARQLFDRVAPDAREPEAAPQTGPAAPAEVAGLYVHERTGDPLRVAVDDGALRVEGGPPLTALATDRFRAERPSLRVRSADRFELRVVGPDALEVVSMEGETDRYRRARPTPLDAAGREVVAGTYASDDLRAVLEVVPTADGLGVRLNGSRLFPLSPADGDAFQLGRMWIRFQRDAAGRTVALDYRNPALGPVRFHRERGTVGNKAEAAVACPSSSRTPTGTAACSSGPRP
ncbi:serine hydrolase domain-containing protein [Rubrivirga sp. IMCC45206]|uniref:serine hydrolase domain-containing protein n=1 Tax=Rubrivirga sp. IMCC45206 TaxID=3391614 RepID=UPI00398FCC9F